MWELKEEGGFSKALVLPKPALSQSLSLMVGGEVFSPALFFSLISRRQSTYGNTLYLRVMMG